MGKTETKDATVAWAFDSRMFPMFCRSCQL